MCHEHVAMMILDDIGTSDYFEYEIVIFRLNQYSTL